MKKKSYDFSGYATKNNLKCSDGRTILKDAFKHNDGQTVPLVWQHQHNEPTNVLGHAVLENREDGVYAYGTFNDTVTATHAKRLVEHGDINALSIYANQLLQKGNDVLHGAIKEVSLVLNGANPGALIDNISFQHADGMSYEDETEAIIYTGESLKHSSDEDDDEDDEDEPTIEDIFDTMTEEQQMATIALIAQAIDDEDDEDDEDEDDEDEYEDDEDDDEDEDEDEVEHQDNEGGHFMKVNVFDMNKPKQQGRTLSHSDVNSILSNMESFGSLKESFLAHVNSYGIENIGYLFPEATELNKTPIFIQRDMTWVKNFMSKVHRSPFSRIKTTVADITADEARARGYVTGNEKKEEIIKLLKRTTTPTTIYKKQKLDRDNVIDITSFEVVSWLKAEMKMMLEEEIARAGLIGDGRSIESDDKIPEENIRPIYKEEAMFAHKIALASTKTAADIIEEIIRSRKYYKGSGNPSLYTTSDHLTDMLLLKDTTGRRIYRTVAELAAELRVSEIIEVPVMENVSRVDGAKTLDLIGIIVNLNDYTMGADKGGEVNMFDDFDIDFNQMKYLTETRCCGALVTPKSAIIVEREQAAG